jgi:hypothetical protein
MVNTFLPYADFKLCASVLDKKRLFKQVVECMQIYKATTIDGKAGWVNHPAVKMWKQWPHALQLYTNIMYDECVHRGFKIIKMKKFDIEQETRDIKIPDFIGMEQLHLSHQASLLRKNFSFYKGIFLPNDKLKDYMVYSYFWPINKVSEKDKHSHISALAEYYVPQKWRKNVVNGISLIKPPKKDTCIFVYID